MKDTQQKDFVTELFKSRYGLVLTEVKTEFGKRTPDFECYVDGHLVFAAELKTFLRQDITEADRYEEIIDEDYITSGSKEDNALNKVGNAIIDSVKQLKSYSCPKILIMLNNSFLDFNDLKHVVDGFLPYYNSLGEIEFIDRSGEKQRSARESLKIIDLIIFVNQYGRKTGIKFLNEGGKCILLDFFGFKLAEQQ